MVPELTVSPAGLAAEVQGLDLRRRLSDLRIAALLDLWHDHPVLVFRRQHLDERQLLDFSRRFGIPEPLPAESGGAPGVACLLRAPGGAGGESGDVETRFSTPDGGSYQHFWQPGDLLLCDTMRTAIRGRPHAMAIRRLLTAAERLSAYA